MKLTNDDGSLNSDGWAITIGFCVILGFFIFFGFMWKLIIVTNNDRASDPVSGFLYSDNEIGGIVIGCATAHDKSKDKDGVTSSGSEWLYKSDPVLDDMITCLDKAGVEFYYLNYKVTPKVDALYALFRTCTSNELSGIWYKDSGYVRSILSCMVHNGASFRLIDQVSNNKEK